MAGRDVATTKKTRRGRKEGSATKMTRARANELMRTSDVMPLDVMIQNMLFWHKHSEKMADGIELMMEKVAESGDPEELKKCTGMLKSFLEARENAQRCAVDAAPYVHPRLQAIKFEKDGETLLEVTMALAPPKVDEEAESRGYRDGYTSVVPLRRSA